VKCSHFAQNPRTPTFSPATERQKRGEHERQFTDQQAAVILGNCTTRIPLKLDLHEGDLGHTVVMAESGKGMSVFQGLIFFRSGQWAPRALNCCAASSVLFESLVIFE
jgi:hypothetical protein